MRQKENRRKEKERHREKEWQREKKRQRATHNIRQRERDVREKEVFKNLLSFLHNFMHLMIIQILLVDQHTGC